jgi:AraC-like DNA-binding protein
MGGKTATPGTRSMPSPALPDLTAATPLNIKNGIVIGLLARADELGVDSGPWFEGTRLDRRHFQADAPAYVSYRQACDIIQRALDSLPGEGHGLEIGARQDVGNFGLLGLAMMTARNFGEALRLGIEFAAITGAMLEMQLVDDPASGDVAVSAWMRNPTPRIEPFLCEELFASCLKLCRGLLGPDFSPRRTELAYPPPAHADEYARVLGCEVRFGAPANRVLIERHWLDAPMGAHNPVSARHVLALCREQMPRGASGNNIVETVGNLLRLQLADSPRLVDIATELHLAERTLRRQLHGAGTSWQELHGRVRRDVAEQMLRRPGIRIAEVGAATGFQDAREFRRAFRRWTGRSPSEIRSRP